MDVSPDPRFRAKPGPDPALCAGVLPEHQRPGLPTEGPETTHGRRDLVRKLLFVRRSKNESSHRVIPLNASALNALARLFERADALGHTQPEHYLASPS